MKTSVVTIFSVAVSSSLVTVGTLEVLRDSSAVSTAEPPPDSAAALDTWGVEPPTTTPRALDQRDDYEDRLIELEQRVTALELGGAAHRVPVASATGEPTVEDDLRVLVLDWVAEEREARRHAAELAQEEARRTQRDFDARYRAHLLALEHDLADWQEDKLAEVFLAVQERSAVLEDEIALLNDDPEEVERRWVEFDEWAERYEREELGQLYDLSDG